MRESEGKRGATPENIAQIASVSPTFASREAMSVVGKDCVIGSGVDVAIAAAVQTRRRFLGFIVCFCTSRPTELSPTGARVEDGTSSIRKYRFRP